MIELITVGSWLFWVSLFIVSAFIWYAEEGDSKGWAVTLTMAMIIVFGYTSIDSLKQLSLIKVSCYIGSYLMIGSTWSVFKWWLRCHRLYDKLKSADPNTIIAGQLQQSRDYVSVAKNKGRLMFWIAYWPWSMLSSILRDTVESVFNLLKRIFTTIANPANALIDTMEEDRVSARNGLVNKP